jgi:hypothetical protein
VALSGIAGVLGDANEGEDRRERGRGIFIWRDGLGGPALAKLGGGVQCWAMRARRDWFLDGRGWPRVSRRACQPCSHVHVRRCSTVAATSNGREGKGGCASRVLGRCRARVREQDRPGASVG